MTILGDIWGALPKEVKFIFAISVFMYAGSAILQGLVAAWNFFGVNGLNAVNGCSEKAANCIPAQNGIFVFGINFADYWTITALIFFPALVLFAIKWYAITLQHR